MLFALREDQKSAAIDIDVLDIIGRGFLFQGVTALDVQKALRASPAKTVNVRVNSAGGVVDEAQAIRNLLKERAANGAKVNVTVLGAAASAATIITDGGTDVAIAEGAYFMIHEASAGTAGRGTTEDHQKTIDRLKIANDALASMYAAASQRRGMAKTEADFREAMKKETYFDAKTAVEWGLADRVVNEAPIAACADITALNNVPETLRMRYEELVAASSEPPVENGAVPYGKYPTKDSGAWDGAAAVERVRKWASSDGSGDPDSVTWAKYRKAFGWYDNANAETFGAYKLPHHDVVNGELVTVRAGVIAAGNALSGSRGGVTIPEGDIAAVKSHLAKHYQEFDLKAPWESASNSGEPATSEKPNASAAGGAQRKKVKMTKEELKAQHPELYTAVFNDGKEAGHKEGEATERKRVLAHLKLADSSGAHKVARNAIEQGKSTMDEEVHAEYMSAAINRRDVQNRQAESDAAGAAANGANGAKPEAAAAAKAQTTNLLDLFASDLPAKAS